MIKLSKKGDYGLKAMVYLAKKHNQLVKISEISENLWISELFLRRIINDLEKSWLVETIKGRNGWVLISKDLKSIRLYDIFLSLWEELHITDCTAGVYCQNKESCITTDVLSGLQKWFNALLHLQNLENITKK